MSTITKLQITSYVVSIMMMLNVFSKPLHIPETFKWVLMLGVFIPLVLLFRLIKKWKLEESLKVNASTQEKGLVADPKKKIRNRLLLMMGMGIVIGLCSPLWLPLTGESLGVRGDFMVGLITTAFVCAMFGIRLRKPGIQ